MTLTIRKKGNKNFWHYANVEGLDLEYSASDLTAIFDGNDLKLRSEVGRVIFDREGYNYSVVTIYDDTVGGGPETFLSAIELEQRLINLGYPAFYIDVNENSATWGGIDVVLENQTDLIDYVNTKDFDGGTITV